MPKTIYLKTNTEFMPALRSGQKPFEIRFNDRDYQIGDILVLKGWDPAQQTYTGEELKRDITYILDKAEPFGLQPGHVILGLGPGEHDLRALNAYPGLQADYINVAQATLGPGRQVHIGWASPSLAFGRLSFGVTNDNKFFMDTEAMSLRFVQALVTQMYMDAHPQEFGYLTNPTTKE
jgi:hypothetical protein